MASARAVCARMLHTSTAFRAASQWRVRRGLAPSGNEYGPLTDLPDFTFVDGRPTPLSLRQRQRSEQNIRLGMRAKELLEEVRYAESVYNEQNRTIQEKDQAIKRSFLKAKGDLLKAPKLEAPKPKAKSK